MLLCCYIVTMLLCCYYFTFLLRYYVTMLLFCFVAMLLSYYSNMFLHYEVSESRFVVILIHSQCRHFGCIKFCTFSEIRNRHFLFPLFQRLFDVCNIPTIAPYGTLTYTQFNLCNTHSLFLMHTWLDLPVLVGVD